MKRIIYKLEFLLIVGLAIASFFCDAKVLHFMAGIQQLYLVYLMQWMTQLGSVFVVMIFMTSLFLWQETKKKWVGVLWLSFLTSGMLALLIKLIVGRPRPAVFGFPVLGSSFPSIHAAIAFATVPVLDKEFPIFKWFWILFAIGVGFSRVFFQFHYISDVFAGAIVGYVVGHFFVVEEERGRYIEWFQKGLRKWI